MEHIHNNDVNNVLLTGGDFFVTPVKCNILFSCLSFLFIVLLIFVNVCDSLKKKNASQYILFSVLFLPVMFRSTTQTCLLTQCDFFLAMLLKIETLYIKFLHLCALCFLYITQKYIAKRFSSLWLVDKQWSFFMNVWKCHSTVGCMRSFNCGHIHLMSKIAT